MFGNQSLLTLSAIISYSQNFIGELAALSAAGLWAASSVIYSRLGVKIPPLKLNFYKGIIAIALIVLTLVWQQTSLANLSPLTVILLLISGAVGIGLGDTAYFAALNNLGARRTLLLETLSPPMGALFALISIGERLEITSLCAILITLLGIVWVISERTVSSVRSQGNKRVGVIWGILAAIAQAGGAVISRIALLQSDISPLASSLIRIVAGVLMIFPLLMLSSNRSSQSSISWQLSRRSLGIVAIAAFGGTYLGIWLQQISLKFSPTGIAQTLLATSPLFVIPIVALLGEKITLRSVLGAAISLAGIALLFFYS